MKIYGFHYNVDYLLLCKPVDMQQTNYCLTFQIELETTQIIIISILSIQFFFNLNYFIFLLIKNIHNKNLKSANNNKKILIIRNLCYHSQHSFEISATLSRNKFNEPFYTIYYLLNQTSTYLYVSAVKHGTKQKVNI